MIHVDPVTLEFNGVRLEPLGPRHHALRRDGTVRDTVMYSVVRGEWHEIKSHLHYRLARHAE